MIYPSCWGQGGELPSCEEEPDGRNSCLCPGWEQGLALPCAGILWAFENENGGETGEGPRGWWCTHPGSSSKAEIVCQEGDAGSILTSPVVPGGSQQPHGEQASWGTAKERHQPWVRQRWECLQTPPVLSTGCPKSVPRRPSGLFLRPERRSGPAAVLLLLHCVMIAGW